jgi:hypothetical protein
MLGGSNKELHPPLHEIDLYRKSNGVFLRLIAEYRLRNGVNYPP